MDATKAFDRVKYSKMFKLLQHRNVCPLVIRLFLVMYLCNTAVVKWNAEYSNGFQVNNGVKQGGVASAHFFAMYMDPLIESIHKSDKGSKIGGIRTNVFAYADDLIILSPTLSALKILVNLCEV